MITRTTSPRRIAVASAAAILSLSVATIASASVPTTASSDDSLVFGRPPVEASYVATSSTLSEAEVADILFMREEEKLAHDVYVTLGDVWGSQIFTNIARAETMHMDSVLTLIETYGLIDPVGDNAVGVFVEPTLQAMYDDLVTTGSESLAAAMSVGALIEEVDIEDLLSSIDETTAPDVALVWERLLSGSQNHLRAFTSQLGSLGVDYEPSILDDEAFDDITTTQTQPRGHGRRGR